MIYQFPVYLENSMVMERQPSDSMKFDKTNGHDAKNIRMTNIVGYEKGDFLKMCPKCKKALPSEAFGLRGTMDRDQSWCIECR